MKTLVIYSSVTGNTEKIVKAAYDEIPFPKKICKSLNKLSLKNYELIIIGYWVDKGICDSRNVEIIKNIHNKKVIFMGTLGAKDNGNYYESIKKRVESFLPEDNKLIDHFLCQGRINEKLIERYKTIFESNPGDENIKRQLENAKIASTHPDNTDLNNVKEFIKNIFKKIEF
ncbi:flavodoxin family protein [Clostridium rectalis]|uniref:flavodoxin family protein n=1 Tax=Clostridium rectalis TaxID=2040295 RepID=UPI000F6448F3|nr:flavodoxin family protein [Clostridium rectalis]